MLKKYILQMIQMNYSMPLDIFMGLVIQYYYSNQSKSIGVDGDFITSPEVSPIFGMIVGGWLYDKKSSNKKTIIVELGAGNATLLSDCLNFISSDNSFTNKDIMIVESSEIMRKSQKSTLEKYIDVVSWYNTIDEVSEKLDTYNEKINIFIIANEFFDALPVKQYIKKNGNFYEVVVSEKDGDLTLMHSSTATEDEQIGRIMQYSDCKVSDFSDDDVFEISVPTLSVVNEMAVILKKHSGGCLIIDYGYIKNPRRNTIKAIQNHKILDSIFDNLGDADLSANVDFSAIINFFNKKYPTYDVQYFSQHDFMKKNHIDEIIKKIPYTQNISMLVDDIGKSFGVIEITKK